MKSLLDYFGQNRSCFTSETTTERMSLILITLVEIVDVKEVFVKTNIWHFLIALDSYNL